MRKGLDGIHKRVEKQFADGDALLKQLVWKSIQQEFMAKLSRYEAILSSCYPDIKKLEFSIEDVLGYFNELDKGSNA